MRLRLRLEFCRPRQLVLALVLNRCVARAGPEASLHSPFEGGVALVDVKTHEEVPHSGTLAAGEMEFMGTGVIAQSATIDNLQGLVIIVR